VGDLMTGMEARLEPVEGIANGGRLFIRGPNIMLGYILPDNPGVIVPPPDGWYDTGDVAQIDDEGFISIRGRLNRFAKIGGEKIALSVVENCAAALWPDSNHAAVSIPDAHKGEQIVLVTDCPQADRPALIGWAQNHGVTELAVPRKILRVEMLPTLGTGKMDYAAIQKMAETADKFDFT
jgi:acyl-[acyl-carrier-protein]-phospholipid O-acyltransferase/long-chain-fatty-acid--[acyl-carrier-protein] ligase